MSAQQTMTRKKRESSLKGSQGKDVESMEPDIDDGAFWLSRYRQLEDGRDGC